MHIKMQVVCRQVQRGIINTAEDREYPLSVFGNSQIRAGKTKFLSGNEARKDH